MIKFLFLGIISMSLGISFSNAQGFARGADIGWLSEMENSGKKFYNDNGSEQDLLQILKDHCINSIRLRVWVNPTNGWCNKADVVAMAKRANAMGFRIMIDFHYSDYWADPGKQTKPAAWSSYTNTQLIQAIYDHTFDVLNAIKAEGVTPEWCQIGNETNDGMLWDAGKASQNMANYAQFVTSGSKAAHVVFPHIITIVHIANGYDNVLFKWNIGGLISNGAQFDAIGMSLYPESTDWQTVTSQCQTNMTSMVNLYNKPIMICEIGMGWDSPVEAKAFVQDIIAKNQSLPDKKGLGVFWWEPQTYNWNNYSKGAFDLSGRPTIALDGFLNDCPPAPVKVKFVADFSTNTTSHEAFITGAMTSDGTNWVIHPMKHESGDIYSIEFHIAPSESGAFYLLNGNDWASRETVPATCATWYNSDRGYEIGTKDTVIYLTWSDCKTSFDCHGTMNGTAEIDACGQCSGGMTGKPICKKQQIELTKGWNLISINVHPTDSSISKLFNGLDVQEIKTMDAFFRTGQPDYLNTLQTIVSGKGYLVNMNNSGVLNLQGFKNHEGLTAPQTGWQLIGCSYPTATPFADVLDSKFTVAKDFSGFWILNGTTNSIENIEPGKAYFIK